MPVKLEIRRQTFDGKGFWKSIIHASTMERAVALALARDEPTEFWTGSEWVDIDLIALEDEDEDISVWEAPACL